MAARRLVPCARLALALALLLPALSLRFASPVGATIVNVYFPQTGHALGYHFKVYWEQHGGLTSFGFPISEEFEEHGRATQYFERAVLQHFPEYAGTPYEVLPTQLGRQLLRGREREAPLRPVTPIAATAERIYFTETGHILQFGFLQAWKAGGGLPVYGYPLTEEFVEVSPSDGRPYTVQYFERNRFEYHPENRGTPYEVQLGLLGAPAFRPLPAPPAVARVVSRGDATRPLVALTFDAGADRGNTGRILDTLAADGYYYNVLWTVDSLGWNGLSAGAIVNRVLGGAAPGAIVLFHVGAASADAAALPAIIDGLRARGYSFATVEELVRP